MAVDKTKVKYIGVYEATQADILSDEDNALLEQKKLYQTTDQATVKLYYATEAGVLVDLTQKGDAHYKHNQTVAATVWNIIHNLGKMPNVIAYDSANTQVEGELTRIDDNSCTLSFTAAFSGVAFCN